VNGKQTHLVVCWLRGGAR